MSDSDKDNQVKGVPDGWEVEHVSRFGEPGEYCVSPEGEPHLIVVRTIYRVCIIRKIEKPAKYRQFANAEEYMPHRDRWWTWKDDRSNTFPPAAFGKLGHHSQSWSDSFDRKVFDDGTPFGVKIDE
jgi:hypothetical protein